jgi:hypothetical protein
LIKAWNHFGQQFSIPDAADFARKNRVLLLRHSPTEIDIDVSLGILPFEEELFAGFPDVSDIPQAKKKATRSLVMRLSLHKIGRTLKRPVP